MKIEYLSIQDDQECNRELRPKVYEEMGVSVIQRILHHSWTIFLSMIEEFRLYDMSSLERKFVKTNDIYTH